MAQQNQTQDGRRNNRGNPQNEVIQITKYLQGADFPASKEDLVQCAQDNGAPEDVVEAIRSLPQDTFNGVTEVTAADSRR